MPADRYFSTDLFEFLTALCVHDQREWFQKNKERYEALVRDPLLRFIADLSPGLRKINSHGRRRQPNGRLCDENLP